MPRYAMILLTVLMCSAAVLCFAEDWISHSNQKYAYNLQYPSSWQQRSDQETGFFEVSSRIDPASTPGTFSVEVDTLSEYERNLDWLDYMQRGLDELPKRLTLQGHTDIKVIASETDTLNGRVVHRITLNSRYYGDLTLKSTIIRIKHNNLHFTLTGTGEEGYVYDQAAADFERMIASFGFQMLVDAYLDDYVRVRADLTGADTVFHWKGTVYSFIPGDKRKELFAVEGYNIVRAVYKENGYSLLGKEVAFFLDHRTGQILDIWRNLITGRDVPVLHVFNDPVNQDLGFTEETLRLLPMILPSTDLGDEIAYHSDIFPYYPNPLPRREFPLSSQSDVYQAAEFIQYIANKADLEDPDLSSVPATYSFTRIYPWLPFMQMGNSTGNVIWVCRGRKLEGGFSALPEYMREYILANKPEFASAPDTWSEDSASIWTYFRELAEQEQTTP